VDIQNATLAGGVAVGSASDLVIGPWGAIVIGCIGGTVSVLGYTKLQPYLMTCGLHDTCGVHNLHGMPGLIGGIAGAITCAAAGESAYNQPISAIYAARGAPDNRSAMEQAGFQLGALLITVAIAIAGGLLVGFLVNVMRVSVDEGHKNFFHDADYWEGVTELEGANWDMGVEELEPILPLEETSMGVGVSMTATIPPEIEMPQMDTQSTLGCAPTCGAARPTPYNLHAMPPPIDGVTPGQQEEQGRIGIFC